jgi:hypothetical protein
MADPEQVEPTWAWLMLPLTERGGTHVHWLSLNIVIHAIG